MVQPGYPVILVAPEGRTLAGMRDVAGALVDKGADLLIISNDEAMLQMGAQSMSLPRMPEWLSPIIAVMPGQVFALQQAVARGLEVDKPRGLSKVTITE